MYRCGQSLQGTMYIPFFVCFDAVLSLCFVKYDLSLCAGLCNRYVYVSVCVTDTWNRYVDDVLATVKKDKTDDILHTINNTTENIKFTKEEEDNNQLAFLDILLTRTDDGTINTQVYRKKTHTDQILNFNSNHPTQHKISCIRILFNWTETELLGRAQTKHAREFKEAWYSIDGNTINRHVEIPTVYLQLKTTRKCPTNNNDTMTNTNFQITIPSTSATQQSKHSNDAIPSSGIHYSSTSNEIRSTTEQPIRRSQRIQERSYTSKL